eukprot:TRINITY_DN51469_c0_g1_i1.p1 TRINITY_DN51469_c0_g1~~TRINITY_DN51469_c0_g1_i1.p1  ORF type:complete len:319 (+),score=22.12 TRINITY_DN51469_c0_g1_i1:44-958(+)
MVGLFSRLCLFTCAITSCTRRSPQPKRDWLEKVSPKNGCPRWKYEIGARSVHYYESETSPVRLVNRLVKRYKRRDARFPSTLSEFASEEAIQYRFGFAMHDVDLDDEDTRYYLMSMTKFLEQEGTLKSPKPNNFAEVIVLGYEGDAEKSMRERKTVCKAVVFFVVRGGKLVDVCRALKSWDPLDPCGSPRQKIQDFEQILALVPEAPDCNEDYFCDSEVDAVDQVSPLAGRVVYSSKWKDKFDEDSQRLLRRCYDVISLGRHLAISGLEPLTNTIFHVGALLGFVQEALRKSDSDYTFCKMPEV